MNNSPSRIKRVRDWAVVCTMLFNPQLLLLAGLCLAHTGAVLAQSSASIAGSVDEAEQMLNRGDSLFTADRPVAALAMYRGA